MSDINSSSTDTRADVADDGATVVEDVIELDFGSNVTITDNGDGTVTVDSTDTDTDTRADIADDGATVITDVQEIDFGSNVSVTDNADGTVTVDAAADTDTRTDVSDGGATVVSEVTDINFGSNVSVQDNGDGTVTVTGSDSSTDTRTDVSDGGATVVSDVLDINFGSDVSVADDGDGTVTVSNTGSVPNSTKTESFRDGYKTPEIVAGRDDSNWYDDDTSSSNNISNGDGTVFKLPDTRMCDGLRVYSDSGATFEGSFEFDLRRDGTVVGSDSIYLNDTYDGWKEASYGFSFNEVAFTGTYSDTSYPDNVDLYEIDMMATHLPAHDHEI